MDIAFFESLTPQDARIYLARFLEVEERATRDMIPHAKNERVDVDFTVASVPGFLKWILKKVKTVPGHPDAELANRASGYSDSQGPIDFAEEAKPFVMRAAFYLGEAFVRHSSCLCWSIGNPETIERNQPVVSGFRSGVEMAPIMVAENLFLRILGDGADPNDIDKAVERWGSMSPSKY